MLRDSNGKKNTAFLGFIWNNWEHDTTTSDTQPRKDMATMWKVDTSDLIMRIYTLMVYCFHILKLRHWHWDNNTIALVPEKQLWSKTTPPPPHPPTHTHTHTHTHTESIKNNGVIIAKQNKIELQCGTVITRLISLLFFSNSPQKTLHNSPVRARYGCLLWLQTLVYILPQSLQWLIDKHVTSDRIITAPDSMFLFRETYRSVPYIADAFYSIPSNS